MEHDHDFAVARAFIEITQGDAGADLKAVRLEGVVGERREGHRGRGGGEGGHYPLQAPLISGCITADSV